MSDQEFNFEGVSDLEPEEVTEPEPELDQTVTPPKPSTEKEEDVDIYATGKTWHEHPMYQCPQCPFDSIERDRVVVHVQRVHAVPATSDARVSQLYDRFNNPLKIQDKKE